MTVVVADAFTASNGTDINGRTPPTAPVGSTWAEIDGGMQITSNAAVPTTSATRSTAVTDHNEADLDFTVEADGGASGASSVISRDSGLLIRYSDANNYWLVTVNTNADVFRIVERNATTETVRASASVTINGGTFYTLTAQVSGTSIVAQIDGGNQITYGSATLNQTAEFHGFHFRNADARIDDYSTDDGVVGGGVVPVLAMHYKRMMTP